MSQHFERMLYEVHYNIEIWPHLDLNKKEFLDPRYCHQN